MILSFLYRFKILFGYYLGFGLLQCLAYFFNKILFSHARPQGLNKTIEQKQCLRLGVLHYKCIYPRGKRGLQGNSALSVRNMHFEMLSVLVSFGNYFEKTDITVLDDFELPYLAQKIAKRSTGPVYCKIKIGSVRPILLRQMSCLSYYK